MISLHQVAAAGIGLSYGFLAALVLLALTYLPLHSRLWTRWLTCRHMVWYFLLFFGDLVLFPCVGIFASRVFHRLPLDGYMALSVYALYLGALPGTVTALAVSACNARRNAKGVLLAAVFGAASGGAYLLVLRLWVLPVNGMQTITAVLLCACAAALLAVGLLPEEKEG